MIRRATIEDIPRLQDMGAKFFAASGLDKWFSYDPRSFTNVVENFMADDRAVVLVGDGEMGAAGMAAALAYPCWFDNRHTTAQELFWWVEPDYRGGPMGTKLRRGLESWARDGGCSTMEMGALEGLRVEAVTLLLDRKGYRPKERVFCKRLS